MDIFSRGLFKLGPVKTTWHGLVNYDGLWQKVVIYNIVDYAFWWEWDTSWHSGEKWNNSSCACCKKRGDGSSMLPPLPGCPVHSPSPKRENRSADRQTQCSEGNRFIHREEKQVQYIIALPLSFHSVADFLWGEGERRQGGRDSWQNLLIKTIYITFVKIWANTTISKYFKPPIHWSLLRVIDSEGNSFLAPSHQNLCKFNKSQKYICLAALWPLPMSRQMLKEPIVIVR